MTADVSCNDLHGWCACDMHLRALIFQLCVCVAAASGMRPNARERSGSPAPVRAQPPAPQAFEPRRSQSPAVAAQPAPAPKKAAKSKLGEQSI